MGSGSLVLVESTSRFRTAALLIITLVVLTSSQEPADIALHTRESSHHVYELLESAFQPAPVITGISSTMGVKIIQDHENKLDPVVREIRNSVAKEYPLDTLSSIEIQSMESIVRVEDTELVVDHMHRSSAVPHSCTKHHLCKVVEREDNNVTILKSSTRKCSAHGCNRYARGLKQVENITADRSVVLITKNGASGEDAASPTNENSKEMDPSPRTVVLITSMAPPSDQTQLVSPETEPDIELDEAIQTNPDAPKSVVLIVADGPLRDISDSGVISELSPAPEMDDDYQVDDDFLDNQSDQSSSMVPIPGVDENLETGDFHFGILSEEEPTEALIPEMEADQGVDDVLPGIVPDQEPGVTPTSETGESNEIGAPNLDIQADEEAITSPAPEMDEDARIDEKIFEDLPKQELTGVPTLEADEEIKIGGMHSGPQPEEEVIKAPIQEIGEEVQKDEALANNGPEEEPFAAPLNVPREDPQLDTADSNHHPEQENDTPPIPELLPQAVQILAPAVENPEQVNGVPSGQSGEANIEEKATGIEKKGDVLLELRFEDLDYDSIMKEGQLEQEMREYILSSIASYGDLHREDVAIVRIRRGSVIVDASLVLHNDKDAGLLLEDLSNNPDEVFPESPYGVPKVSVIGGSVGNQFLQSVRGTIQNSSLGEESLQEAQSPMLPTQLNATESSVARDASETSPEEGISLSGSDDNGYAVVRLTFDWLNVIEDDAKAASLRKSAIMVMSQANGTYQGHVDVIDFVAEELSTEVVVKASMATGNNVYDFQHLFDVLDLDPPQPTWVFGDTFTYGEFLPPRVTFIEIGNEEGAVFVLTSSAKRKALVTALLFVCVFLGIIT